MMKPPCRSGACTIAAAVFPLLVLCGASICRAADFDCGPQPSLSCITPYLFAAAKSPAVDEFIRSSARFAESELAAGNIAVAVEYVITDNPDPSPWEHIQYMARAGLFDRAIEESKRAELPEGRIGGMLAVAWQLAEAKAFDRAAKILDETEPQLASVADSDYSHAAYAAEIWAKIGQFDRTARLLSDDQARSIIALLDIATKYPANAAALRQQTWAQAERANDRTKWQLIAEDAAKRGDAETTSRAAQRALALPLDDLDRTIRLAKALLTVGLPDQASKVIDSWPVWTKAKQGSELANLIRSIVPLLAQLNRDEEIEPAAKLIQGHFARSGTYSQAAEEFFRLGRWYLAAKFEAKAIEVAESAPYDDRKSQWERDAAFHNLALMRSRRGDVRGALEMTSQVGDGIKMREVTSYVIRAALDGGYGVAAVPAIDRLATLARANGNASLLVEAASATNRLGQKDKAREMLAEARVLGRRGADSKLELYVVPELMWRIDGNLQPALDMVAVAGTEAERSGAFKEFAGLVAPSSPADALKIAGRISDPKYQLEALSSVAEALLAAERK
jgi:tetratricopeptide (TPR) repeat protein